MSDAEPYLTFSQAARELGNSVGETARLIPASEIARWKAEHWTGRREVEP